MIELEVSLRTTLARLLAGPVEEIAPHRGSGRHRLWVVQVRAGSRCLVKTFPPSGSEGNSELWFYERISPAFEHTPRPLIVAPDDHLIVLEYCEDAMTLLELARQSPDQALRVLAELAPVLRTLHKTQMPRDDSPEFVGVLPPLDPVPVELWNRSSDGAREVIRHVQRRPLLAGAYAETRRMLKDSAVVVHGDIKPDNILVTERGPRLVDWELSGFGPPLADIGAVIGSMICLWIDGLAIEADTPTDAWLLAGALPWTAIQDSFDRFLTHYDQALAGGDGAMTRASAVRAAAAWLVARAWADASVANAAFPQTLLRVVVANALMKDTAHLARAVS